MNGAAVVEGWARAVARFADEWPNRGAAVASRRVDAIVAADTGGDGRLSNYRGGRATVAVEEGGGEAAVRADGSLGLWSILEEGTKAHTVRARPGGFLATPFGPRRMVQVAGVHARQTWTKGAAAGLVAAERDAYDAFDRIA